MKPPVAGGAAAAGIDGSMPGLHAVCNRLQDAIAVAAVARRAALDPVAEHDLELARCLGHLASLIECELYRLRSLANGSAAGDCDGHRGFLDTAVRPTARDVHRLREGCDAPGPPRNAVRLPRARRP